VPRINRIINNPIRTGKPVIMPNGLVKVDGVTIGRLTRRRTLQVWDKDRGRAMRRGSNTVEVLICDLLEICGNLTDSKNGGSDEKGKNA
jgi:hypothetical protein